MKAKTPTRTQAQRTEETRNKLLDAAKGIFVRSGFEAATIEEIAKRAGYTRGAFYCNFKGKEDIFIKAMERVLGQLTTEFEDLAHKYPDPSERLAGMQKLYARFSTDETALLLLEFKLYAVRHPKRHAKLAAAYAHIRRSREHLLENAMKDLGLKLPVGADMLEAAFPALLTGLLLDRAFYVHDYRPAPVELESTVNLFFERVINYNHRI